MVPPSITKRQGPRTTMFALRRTMATMAAQSSSLKQAGKVVCIGRNYADHIAELKNTKPKQPFFFLKPPSSIVLPGEGACLRPKGVDMHYEVELALIMGKVVRDLRADDKQGALEAIQAYAIAIDMTARNAQNEAKKKGLPWDIAKGFDTFLPMSQVIPKDTIRDPHDVELFLQVNGETKQQGSTNLMIFQIPRILSDISKVMTLHPGDIVLTGTPAGVGPAVPGDVIRAGVRIGGEEVEQGKIEVPVEESPSSYVFAETLCDDRGDEEEEKENEQRDDVFISALLLAAARAGALLLVVLEVLDGLLDLGAEVGAVEGGLVDDGAAAGAVPAHAVERVAGPALLEDDADRVGEADGVVRGVAGQQEHVALADDDVAEDAVVDDLEHHGALVLVEPLGRLVDVVVGAGVGPADDLERVGKRAYWSCPYHDAKILIVDAVVVDGWLQEMGIFLKPGHGGRLK
ncbi:3-hydroxyanthranilate 3 4-dioxygenase [Paramyrothecium foliicola]|nr:3-hydroxyanthranilate 3 4-dioxygenase [Paramyrothecium foliicola]